MIIIYISGIDGCGKTTQSNLLKNYLAERNIAVQYEWLRWDPSFRQLFVGIKSIVGRAKTKGDLTSFQKEQIRHTRWFSLKKTLLSNSLCRWLWWEYACRDYMRSIQKTLKKISADVLIVDRYIYDFVIDQAVNLGVEPDEQGILVDKLIERGFKFPELTIIINLPAQEGYNRKLDGTPLDYLREREKRYHLIPENEQTLHLDGMRNIDSLAVDISNWVSKKISS
jgi:thymidylate kinase